MSEIPHVSNAISCPKHVHVLISCYNFSEAAALTLVNPLVKCGSCVGSLDAQQIRPGSCKQLLLFGIVSIILSWTFGMIYLNSIAAFSLSIGPSMIYVYSSEAQNNSRSHISYCNKKVLPPCLRGLLLAHIINLAFDAPPVDWLIMKWCPLQFIFSCIAYGNTRHGHSIIR